MPRQSRTRAVSASQVRAYLVKAEQYLDAAAAEFAADRPIAATSLAVHAAINAADAVTGTRLGRRAAGQDHDEALGLLREAGKDGAEVAGSLVRLLPMKTKGEYEPAAIPKSAAEKAVAWARRCVVVARRVVEPKRS